jgi:hypothetical protein
MLKLKNKLLSGMIFISFIVLFFSGNGEICAQEIFKPDAQARAAVITKIASLLDEKYVFPEMGKKIGTHILEKVKSGAYGGITDARDFAKKLTTHLREINNDRHLEVRFSPKTASVMIKGNDTEEEDAKESHERRTTDERRLNYGFEKVERLKGNIGYLDLRFFCHTTYEGAGETAEAVMNFLSSADAVILDLRKNGGGAPEMVQLISSYFFDDESKLLFSFYERPIDTTTQYWTLPHVAGKRMTDIDLYLLTSRTSISSPELMAFSLRDLKRCVIIGEKTAGAAHPSEIMAVDENFLILIPIGYTIGPVTKKDWEGVGIIPDFEVPAEKALETAHIMALKNLLTKTTDEKWKEQIDKYIKELEK